jgi:hypothetical protein
MVTFDPDCRKEYIKSFEVMANLATKQGVEGKKLTIHTPLINLHKAESSFLCRFRIESINVLFKSTIRFSVPCVSSSTVNFAHLQMLSRMNSLSGRMNMHGSTSNTNVLTI